MPRALRCVLALFALVMLLPVAYGGGPDAVFEDSFELPFGLPETDAEAARFLSQASFGATPTSIGDVRNSGIEGWITTQAALPPTLSRAFLEGLAVTENSAGNPVDQIHRIQRWFNVAVTAPDQLRQRVAWALGQVVVTSDLDAGLSDETIMMAEWNDLIVRNALGNFRTLLRETVRSPMMGRYLTHLRNRKFEIRPRCWDQRPGSGGLLDHNLGGNPPYHDCLGGDATNNNTMTPRIAMYVLPSSGLVAPDENFAREIMQLFTIGLIERNPDFSPIPDAINPTPTYDQKTVTTLSRVLTGLGYACSGTRVVAGQTIPRTCNCTGTDCSYQTGNFFSTPPSLTITDESDLVHPDRYEPMICYPRYHDVGRDRSGFHFPGSPPSNPPGAVLDLAAGQSVPGGTPNAAKALELGGAVALTLNENDAGLTPFTGLTNCDPLGVGSAAADKAECLSYCDSEIDAAVNMLFNEPNTAVMISRQLIQRLVSSNPSPEYIERVTNVFVNNGVGVRGDLRAVVKAVLTDIEARQPVGSGAVDAGKPREPLLKLVQLWRSFGAVSGDTRADGYRRWANTRTCGSFSFPQCAYQQRPFGAPSVFNFYEPDYAVPGVIATLGLVSPEFQIINESSSVSAGNDMYGQLCNGRGTGSNHNCHGPLRATVPTDSAYFPDAALDALPGASCGSTCTASDDATLIEALNVRLLGGNMSGALGDLGNPGNAAANTGMKGTLLRLLQLGLTVSPTPTTPLNAGGFVEALPQNVRRREILYLLHIVAISPEYATQR